MKKILISGGTGLIGSRLTGLLVESGYEVNILTRFPDRYKSTTNVSYFFWDWKKKEIEMKAFEEVDVLIHLAGANIAEKRWTDKYKAEMAGSRILSLKFLQRILKENNIPLKLFIGASAIGYYGCVTDDRWRKEDDPPGDDFLAFLVKEWEDTSFQMKDVAERVAVLRTGIVWAREGGAFPKMIGPVKWGLTSPLGKGNQYLDWIHVDDLVRMYHFVLKQSHVEGVYNAVAPRPVTYKEFVKLAAKILKRPCCLPAVPSFLLKLVFGEQACLMLEGMPISSEKIIRSGFRFRFDNAEDAIGDLIQSS